MKTKIGSIQILLLLIVVSISITSFAQSPTIVKKVKKHIEADSNVAYNVTISEKMKFEKDSTSYQAFVFYTAKENSYGAKEIYIRFNDYKVIFYKNKDSVFLFNIKTRKYYQSNIKTDSSLYYFTQHIFFNEFGPLFCLDFYLLSPFASKVHAFNTNIKDCLGLTYKQMSTGNVTSYDFGENPNNMFKKTCCLNTIIDTINNSFKSLYMSMDTSLVAGNNTYSMNYIFDKVNTTPSTKDSLRQLINVFKNAYQLSVLDSNFGFDIMKKETIQNQKTEVKHEAKLADASQKYDIPLQTIANSTIKLSDYKGKYLLLDFWFINCPPCMRGVPNMDSIYERYKHKDFQLIAINPFDKELDGLKDVIQKRNMKYMICMSDKTFPDYFKVPYYPTYILLAPDQKTYKTIVLHTDTEFSDFIKEMDKKLGYK